MKLSIIILTYNTQEQIKTCVNSIISQYGEEIDKGEMELIVADNGSSDNTISILKTIKGIRIVENGKNFGFGKGNNLAAKKAKGNYIIFLNSDIKVKDKGFLKMLKYMDENSNVGILGGKLKNFDGTDQKSSGKFYTLLNRSFYE